MKTCLECGEELGRSGKYCSNACQGARSTRLSIESWLRGEDPGHTGKSVKLKDFVRRYILERDNFSCVECGWQVRHPVDNLPLVEVDHINGNPRDCTPGNLRTLCPNHHATTPTHRNRNRGFGRSS